MLSGKGEDAVKGGVKDRGTGRRFFGGAARFIPELASGRGPRHHECQRRIPRFFRSPGFHTPFIRKTGGVQTLPARMVWRLFLDHGQQINTPQRHKEFLVNSTRYLCVFVPLWCIYLSFPRHGADRRARIIQPLRLPDFRANAVCLHGRSRRGEGRSCLAAGFRALPFWRAFQQWSCLLSRPGKRPQRDNIIASRERSSCPPPLRVLRE